MLTAAKSQDEVKADRRYYGILLSGSFSSIPMTSFIIGAHTNRNIPTEWRDDADRNCPFCRIIAGEMPSTRLYEDDKVIAILGTWC